MDTKNYGPEFIRSLAEETPTTRELLQQALEALLSIKSDISEFGIHTTSVEDQIVEAIRSHLEKPEPAEVESTWLSLSAYEALMQERQETLTELATSQALLKETRANDLHSMRYLSEVRGLVGGDDYPDMIARISELVRSHK
jgi:hypothetical protein